MDGFDKLVAVLLLIGFSTGVVVTLFLGSFYIPAEKTKVGNNICQKIFKDKTKEGKILWSNGKYILHRHIKTEELEK